jgi:hypothetical protein
MAHPADRQRGVVNLRLLGAVAALHWRRRRQALCARRGDMLAGEHADYARHGKGRGSVDGDDARVRPVGAYEMRVGLPGKLPVGDVAPPTLQHALVF